MNIFRCLNGLILFIFSTTIFAGAPLWTFTPLTTTNITVASNATATIQYQVTNQSRLSHTLVVKPIAGITQVTTYGNCTNPFTLAYQQSCILSLSVNGSELQGNVIGGPQVCQQGSVLQCYQPTAANILNITRTLASDSTTLSASASILALAASGNARQITITNTGTVAAQNIMASLSALPSGSSIASTTCNPTLAAGASCTVIISPGASSSNTAGQLTVAGSNTNTLTVNLYVLNYGNIYQQGYLFNIDDSTPVTGSIGGTTLSLMDNSSSIQWYNGSFIQTGAASLTEGLSNTTTITMAQGSGVYAASACAAYQIDSAGNSPCATGTCYTNWYLPAICQMGAVGEGANCVSGTQNVSDNLASLVTGCSGSGCLNGVYWSSTESSIDPINFAWFEAYNPGSSNSQAANAKNNLRALRCARNLA